MSAPSAATSGPKRLVLLGDVPGAASWTDPEVVNRLTIDCRWRPINPKDADDRQQRNPLSCHLPIIQTCVPYPCDLEKEEECKPACTRDCHTCAGKCTNECETCKAPCKDEACRHACAEQCGKCRNACLTAVDQCETGVCNMRAAVCEKQNAAELGKPSCKSACANAQKCSLACPETDGGGEPTCVQACRKKLAQSCNERLFDYCVRAGK
jgi:hypothetical protein